MYSFHECNQAANRREAMTAAQRTQEPQVIAAAMPVQPTLLSSLLSLIINPLLIYSIISLIIIVSLVLILLGL